MKMEKIFRFPEGKYTKKAILALEEAGYKKKKFEKEYLQLQPAIKDFAKTYRATFAGRSIRFL